jgi:DNA-binding MarR family transcriptional regulator
MRQELDKLDKLFDNKIRIGIMSALMVNESMNFNDLKALLSVTDGNLASHLKALEEHQYIHIEKGFIGRKTNTTYSITTLGEKSFRKHITALEKIFNNLK